MKYLYVIFTSLVLFILIGADWVGAEEKTYPPNKEIELVGFVKEGVGYDANNTREEYFYLSLERSISVGADEYSGERNNVKKIQLVPLSGVSIGAFLGKRVAIRGKLFHADSAHHHTQVLLEVGKSNSVKIAR